MLSSRRTVLHVGLGLGFAVLVACSGGSGTIENASSSGAPSGSSSSGSSGSSGSEPTPQEEVTVSPPSSALEVTATIISASLGDDCGGERGSFAGDCAPDAEGKGCGSVCQESNVQLSFKTGAGSGAKVEITSVTLHEATTGTQVDTLDASSPKSWTGSAYAPWDEMLAPSTTVKASYDLSAPSWSTIQNPGGKSSYSTTYRLRVALKIDGVSVVLESKPLLRDPMVAT